MAKHKTDYSIHWNILYGMLIILCMMPGYLLAPYGMWFVDEPYQIMNTMDISRSSVAPLTSWAGGILGHLTDFSWLSFRYLAVTLNNLAILVAGIYLYRRAKSFKIAAIAISAAIFLSGLSRDYHNVFGWDNFTSLFTAILIISVLELIHKPDFRCLLVTCAVAALTISVRIPNAAVVIPVGWLILFLTATIWHSKEKGMPKSYPWLYVLFSGIFFVLIISGLYGSPGIYLESLQDNMLSNHSAAYLLRPIIRDLTRDVAMVMMLGMMVKVLEGFRCHRYCKGFPRLQKPMELCVPLCAAGFLCLVMFFFSLMLSITWYDIEWIFLALAFVIWRNFQKGDSEGAVNALTVLLMGCACFVGSNVGFKKYPGYILIPVTTALLLPLCGSKKVKYYALIAALPLVVMDYFTVRDASFWDCGVAMCDARVSHGRAKGLYSTAERVGIAEALAKIKEENPESVKIVAGEECDRFGYEYFLDFTDAYKRHDWSMDKILDTQEYVDWLHNRIESEDKPMVIYIRPKGRTITKVGEYLDASMRVSAEYDAFIIYVK